MVGKRLMSLIRGLLCSATLSLLSGAMFLVSCNHEAPKSRGRISIENSSSLAIEVLEVVGIGETSLKGTLSPGGTLDGWFVTDRIPTECKIRWRGGRAGAEIATINLEGVDSSELGGYRLRFLSSGGWIVVEGGAN